MQFHKLANIFPLLDGAEFDALVEDIKNNGLHEPICLFEDQILDGRNRWRACLLADVEPRYTDYSGSDPLGYVVSLNLHRRHLNETQRGVVAAKLANLDHGQRSDRVANLQLHVATSQYRVAMPKVQVRTPESRVTKLSLKVRTSEL